MLMIQKYGGTSLETPARMKNAARRAVEAKNAGWQVVVVVSAMGNTTDQILKKARLLSKVPEKRELDACLASGEQLSAALMALAILEAGVPARSLTGGRAGILTDGNSGDARILKIDPEPIRTLLEAGFIPVVAGFQGMDECGNTTTLGRGGSDTTAAALAGFLRADRCCIYTDVDGVYDRDPRIFPDAKKYKALSYDAMLSMAKGGAQVLHPRAVETARAFGIPLEVLSSFRNTPGTLVH